MSNPYENLPATAYWRPAVADAGPHQIEALWTPKFPVRKDDVVVTAGSCFAQHIGRALMENGFT